MKKIIAIILVIFCFSCTPEFQETQEAQSRPVNETTENLIVITLDGLRWQEVFGEEDVLDRNYLASIGNLYGDRNQGNLVNVANGSRISYPGYHEIFTGNTTRITSNDSVPNPHKTVFEFISEQEGYAGRDVFSVSANTLPLLLFRPFTSTFPILTPGIFVENRNAYLFGYDDLTNSETIENAELINWINTAINKAESFHPINNFTNGRQGEELLVYLTYKEILTDQKPKVSYLYFSATDKFAHEGKWDDYINAGKNVSIYIKDLLSYVNETQQYANNTTILITTDHGRGETNWKRHGSNVIGADETWFIVISPTTNKGIVTEQKQYYNEQFAQTMANILGLNYEAEHEIAPGIEF